MAAWVDPLADEDMILGIWRDAPDEPSLGLVLGAAQEQCEEYAPALAEDEAVPNRYKLAVIQQARALWQSSIAGPDDGVGLDGQRVTVFPMDWTVKRLLRPARGVPVVG